MSDLSFLKELRGKKILFAPLDWGLGHATRTSAIIERLKDQNEVQIASSGIALKWLKNKFPDKRFHLLPSYDIRYKFKAMWLNILTSLPQLIKAINKEHKTLEQLMKLHKYDLIIADHRFGTHNKNCRSVVIAHQIQIPHRNNLLAILSSKINRYLLNKYDEVWIPDFKEPQKSLSGRLSKNSKIKTSRHIGPLSILSIAKPRKEKKTDIAIILSGPEPSRSNLENHIAELLESRKELNMVLIRGSDQSAINPALLNRVFKNVIDIADSDTVMEILSNATHIICRSGYSTIMDLELLNKKAILIPTQNQPEQEYLADYHRTRGYQSLKEEEIIKQPNLLFSLLDSI